ncbi:MAG: hypothetical protein IKW02_03285 [Clostridia bacterium]|nr:hypothetical protein [Clostridia bacterium]
MDISKIDKNFNVKKTVDMTGMKVYDVLESPFKVYGVIPPNEKEDQFVRLPGEVSEKVSNWVHMLHTCTAGGRVKFATNSGKIAIRAYMPNMFKMSHYALTGSIGLDLYADNKFVKTFVPPFDIENGYESVLATDGEMHEYTINMPSYAAVSRLYVMLEEGAELKEAAPYRDLKPIVYYGSSITQGGCSSRPGNTYQNVVVRRTNIDYVNLGFSGAAKAEDAIAEYIAGLDMSLFVFDYDHNAPTLEHLENTHEKMFKTIRAKNPDLPIICVSKPDKTSDWEKRREVIRKTVENAKAAGDKNVYFIDGQSFSALCDEPDAITVDGCHPNDLGFAMMGKVIGEKIEEIIGK